MNSIDAIILIILGIFCIKGLFRGIIIEVFTLVGLVLAYVIALREMNTAATWIGLITHLPSLISSTLGFFIIFIIVMLLFRLLAGTLRHLTRGTIIGWLDKGGGIFFGLFKGALIASLLTIIISLVPVPKEVRNEQENSLLFRPIQNVAPTVFNFFKQTFPQTKDFYEEIREGFSATSKKIVDEMLSRRLEFLQKGLKDQVELESLQKELENSVKQK